MQLHLTETAMPEFTLISHVLCPYVQRAVITLAEKNVRFARIDIDLGAKPEWFKALSPLGKTPVLRVDNAAVFESSVILEYLEDTQPSPLHPVDALERARHRAWIEFASAGLNDIAGLYNAPDEATFMTKARALADKFTWAEGQLGDGPYFTGGPFSLVDAAFGPVFRYFDVFDDIGDFGVFASTPKVKAWRKALSARASVQQAVAIDYPQRLQAFLKARGSHMSRLMR
jgi:glutathione S-transferase